MRLVWFTDSNMREWGGDYYPVIDESVHFIPRISERLDSFTMLSRCLNDAQPQAGSQPIAFKDNANFVALPFYKNTIDYYKRLPLLLLRTFPIANRYIKSSDVVVIRHHNCFSWLYYILSKWHGKPVVSKWASAIDDFVQANFPSSSLFDRMANIVAKFEMWYGKKIAHGSSLNLILDDRTYNKLGRPLHVHKSVISFVSDIDLESSLERDQWMLVYAGRLTRSKGVHDLLEVFSTLISDFPRARLSIAGVGDYEEKLKELCREKNMEDKVLFLGRLTRSELRKLFQTSGVFVSPSYAEGLPKIMWEAWASRIAVVMSDVGGVPEYLRDGVNGKLVQPGDHGGLSLAIRDLLSNPEHLKKISDEGWMTAKQHTWEMEIDKMYEAIYKSTKGAQS